MWKKAFLRIIDANFNRAKEALRVAEDILRFVLNSKPLSARCKTLRHRLTQNLAALPVPYAKIIASRETRSDVGRENFVNDKKKTGPVDILIRNVKRAEEAIRVLEEVTRVLAPGRAEDFERLRFSVYDLEKQAFKKFQALRGHRS